MLSAVRKSASRGTANKIISRGFAKEIKFGVDGRAAMLRGVETLADAVQVRVFERSRSVAYRSILLSPYPTVETF
jgi:chaperonin GroEL